MTIFFLLLDSDTLLFDGGETVRLLLGGGGGGGAGAGVAVGKGLCFSHRLRCLLKLYRRTVIRVSQVILDFIRFASSKILCAQTHGAKGVSREGG